MVVTILLGAYLAFVALVYIVMWYEDIYYSKNLKKRFKAFKDSFTEE